MLQSKLSRTGSGWSRISAFRFERVGRVRAATISTRARLGDKGIPHVAVTFVAAAAALGLHACHLAAPAAAAQELLLEPLQEPPSASQTLGGCGQTCSDRLQKLTELSAHLPPLPADFPPLPGLNPPPIEMVSLSNGLQVYLLEDHEVPLVKGTLLMAGGQTASPADKVGLATVAAAVQRAGGSQQHPADTMDAMLDDLAAYVEVNAGHQATTVDWECETPDLPAVLQLAGEVVQQPLLPEGKLQLIKAQVDNLLQHRDDNAGAVAQRELRKLVYGQDSIYARTPRRAEVAGFQTQDLAGWLSTWQRPDSALLGLVGDFKAQEVVPLLKQTLGSWQPAGGQPAQPLARPRQDPASPPSPAAAAEGSRLVYLVDRPGAKQASVAVGEPGIRLSDPDVFALDVLSTLLNSFGGVLFDTLRSREGLAYSVSASWDSPPDHLGMFTVAAETSQPAKYLQELAEVLQQVQQQPPSEEQLGSAKSEALNSWVFNFASRRAQLRRVVAYELLGVPQDFLFQYKKGVEAVTPAGVQQAAQCHMHPQQQTVVVVGDAASVGPQLQQAGFTVQPLALQQD